MKVLYEAILEFYEGSIKDMCMDNNIPYAFDYAKEGVRDLYDIVIMWFHQKSTHFLIRFRVLRTDNKAM